MFEQIKKKWNNLDKNKKRVAIISACVATTILTCSVSYHVGKKMQIKRDDLHWKRMSEKYSQSRLSLFERSGELPYGIKLLYTTPDEKGIHNYG